MFFGGNDLNVFYQGQEIFFVQNMGYQACWVAAQRGSDDEKSGYLPILQKCGYQEGHVPGQSFRLSKHW